MKGVIACALLLPALAWAGAQEREVLTEDVRTRLASAVSHKPVANLVFKNSQDGQRWITAMADKLAKRIPERKERMELLRTIHFEAVRAGLDPQLVLGVIEIESGFRKYAVSGAGAQGYMQVMPFWKVQAGRSKDNMFHMRTNLIYGCWILRRYLDIEKGDYVRALGRYNGSLGRRDYPDLVISAWKGKWKYDGPTA